MLNDFVAVGYAIPTLSIPDDVVTINHGQPVPGGPIAVLGPGTGLGEVQLMWDSGAAPPSQTRDVLLCTSRQSKHRHLSHDPIA